MSEDNLDNHRVFHQYAPDDVCAGWRTKQKPYYNDRIYMAFRQYVYVDAWQGLNGQDISCHITYKRMVFHQYALADGVSNSVQVRTFSRNVDIGGVSHPYVFVDVASSARRLEMFCNR